MIRIRQTLEAFSFKRFKFHATRANKHVSTDGKTASGKEFFVLISV